MVKIRIKLIRDSVIYGDTSKSITTLFGTAKKDDTYKVSEQLVGEYYEIRYSSGNVGYIHKSNVREVKF